MFFTHIQDSLLLLASASAQNSLVHPRATSSPRRCEITAGEWGRVSEEGRPPENRPMERGESLMVLLVHAAIAGRVGEGTSEGCAAPLARAGKGRGADSRTATKERSQGE